MLRFRKFYIIELFSNKLNYIILIYMVQEAYFINNWNKEYFNSHNYEKQNHFYFDVKRFISYQIAIFRINMSFYKLLIFWSPIKNGMNISSNKNVNTNLNTGFWHNHPKILWIPSKIENHSISIIILTISEKCVITNVSQLFKMNVGIVINK